LLAALKHDRKAMGIDREINYINEAKSRIGKLFSGELPYRTLGKPVHQPTGKEKVAQVPQEWLEKKESHEISSGLLV
jgi:adenine-specific DNA-methyltransferase